VSARIVVIALVLTSMACGSARTFPCDAAITPRAPRNFAQVLTADGRPTAIYRGGQPTDCGQLEYLRSIGIRRILKLNERELPQDSAERAHAMRLGFEALDLSFRSASIGRAGTCARVREALSFLERNDGPVYVHCTAGKDRTGYIIGLYEKLVLRKPSAEVMEELRRFGHRGLRSALMPQIDRELRKDVPECAVE
jgi:hypothetical protein